MHYPLTRKILTKDFSFIVNKKETIGATIRQIRKICKMTQNQVVDKVIGINQAKLHRIEAGKQDVTLAELENIFNALGYKLTLKLEKI